MAVLATLLSMTVPRVTHGQVTPEVVSQAIASACADPPDPHSQAVVAGVVLDSISGVVLPDVEVTLSWLASATDTAMTQTTTTGNGGFFAFCNVPAGVRARLRVRRRVGRGPISWTIEPGQLYVQNILLSFSTTTGAGVLVGQVIDADTRRPIVDVSLRLAELDQTVTTNSHGMFTFGTQPLGEIASERRAVHVD